jgi:hypothetical protein
LATILARAASGSSVLVETNRNKAAGERAASSAESAKTRTRQALTAHVAQLERQEETHFAAAAPNSDAADDQERARQTMSTTRS